MKKTFILTGVFSLFILASSCKKEGETIINNYNNDNGTEAPKRKLISSYGNADNSFAYNMTFRNDEIGKMEELVAESGGVPSARLIFNYDNNGKPKNFQIYNLPANSLSSQGNLVMDSKNRIIKVVLLQVNADTNSIYTYTYSGADYQPTSFTSYDKSSDRITDYCYYTYDSKGNVTKAVNYYDNGSDPIYKSSVTECSTFTEGINPLNQLYYLIALQGSGGSQSPLYFSNYFPVSVREESFNKNGVSTGVDIETYSSETDGEGYVTNVTTYGTEAVIKYK